MGPKPNKRSRPLQKPGPNSLKRRRVSDNDQDQSTVDQDSIASPHHDQEDVEAEKNNDNSNHNSANDSQTITNNTEQLKDDSSSGDSSSSESGISSGSDSDDSDSDSDSDSDEDEPTEPITIENDDNKNKEDANIVEEITADDEPVAATTNDIIEEIVPDKDETNKEVDSEINKVDEKSEKQQQEEVGEKMALDEASSVMPNNDGPLTSTTIVENDPPVVPDNNPTTATEINTFSATNTEEQMEQNDASFVDENVRGPSSEGFFFTREAYEAYSADSIQNIVKRHIEWINQHKKEAGDIYRKFLQPSQSISQDKITTSAASPSRGSTPGVAATADTTASNIPTAIQQTSQIPATATSDPLPSSQKQQQTNVHVLDNLLDSIYNETKTSSPSKSTTVMPSDMAVAAAASSGTPPIGEADIFLGDGVKDIYQSLCKIDRQRVKQYPQHYEHLRDYTAAVPEVHGKVLVLDYKRTVGLFGKIGTAPITGNFPEKIDMKKNYVQALSADTKDYYCKKIPPPISQDTMIPSLAKNMMIDVAVSLETLVKLVQLPNEPSLEFDIPVIVRENEKEKGSKILYMDQPLFHDKIKTNEQNQIVYNLAFKSFCVDWKSRHSLENNGEIKDPENTSRWNYKEDENIRYDLYTFGEQTILLRRQQDALLDGVASSNKQAYISSVLDYNTDTNRNVPVIDPLHSASTRASYWLQSYVSGHGKILEGKINVAKNELIAMRCLHMRDVMHNWTPSRESEYLRTLLLNLIKWLEPGQCYLLRKNKDAPLSIFQSTSDNNSQYDLYREYPFEQETSAPS